MANMQIRLPILSVVGSPIWVSTDDGQKVYEKIIEAFDAGHRVILSFAGCRTIIPVFLNAAIGQLYSRGYGDEFISNHLAYADINPEGEAMVESSISNIKRYLANRSGYDKAWKEVVDEDEE